jgi:hypothetical protein
VTSTSGLPDDGTALSRAGRAGARRASARVRALFEAGGRGFRDLALVQVGSTANDTLVAIGLAGTLFFGVPSAEARGNVALYLLLTVAPFSLIGPVLGRLLHRSPLAIRSVLVFSALGRAGLALLLVVRLDGWILFPAAFGLLVLSRVYAISRHALLPAVLEEPRALVAANGRLAWIGTLAGGIAAPFGLLAISLLGPAGPLALAALAALATAMVGSRLPDPEPTDVPPEPAAPGLLTRVHLPRPARMAQIATAVVRLLNGFLLLLLAFAFHQQGAPLMDFGAVLGAAGVGYALASLASRHLERRLREEPMVVAALAVEAAAAFSAGQWFGLPAAAALAAAAGFAWGTAKLAFDGLLQSSVPAERRGTAFTRSETLFAIAWVAGAIWPTAIPLPPALGLALAGFVALTAQIVYVGALLVPPGGHPVADAPTRPGAALGGATADGEDGSSPPPATGHRAGR